MIESLYKILFLLALSLAIIGIPAITVYFWPTAGLAFFWDIVYRAGVFGWVITMFLLVLRILEG